MVQHRFRFVLSGFLFFFSLCVKALLGDVAMLGYTSPAQKPDPEEEVIAEKSFVSSSLGTVRAPAAASTAKTGNECSSLLLAVVLLFHFSCICVEFFFTVSFCFHVFLFRSCTKSGRHQAIATLDRFCLSFLFPTVCYSCSAAATATIAARKKYTQKLVVLF
jgi:hypothetical protein